MEDYIQKLPATPLLYQNVIELFPMRFSRVESHCVVVKIKYLVLVNVEIFHRMSFSHVQLCLGLQYHTH
jgi:hypothetical protein